MTDIEKAYELARMRSEIERLKEADGLEGPSNFADWLRAALAKKREECEK